MSRATRTEVSGLVEFQGRSTMGFAALHLLVVILLSCGWVQSQGNDVSLDDLLREIFTQAPNTQQPVVTPRPIQPAASGNATPTPLIRPQPVPSGNGQSPNSQVH